MFFCECSVKRFDKNNNKIKILKVFRHCISFFIFFSIIIFFILLFIKLYNFSILFLVFVVLSFCAILVINKIICKYANEYCYRLENEIFTITKIDTVSRIIFICVLDNFLKYDSINDLDFEQYKRDKSIKKLQATCNEVTHFLLYNHCEKKHLILLSPDINIHDIFTRIKNYSIKIKK